MADPIRQFLSQTAYVADGITTLWNFSMAGGYLSTDHVKVARRDPVTSVTTQIPIVAADFIGAYQLRVVPAVAAGQEVIIYRDTPKVAPLVDFSDRAPLTEAALDINAKQAVFLAAEFSDFIASTNQSVTYLPASAASGIGYTPGGGIVATTVQGAIAELDADKASIVTVTALTAEVALKATNAALTSAISVLLAQLSATNGATLVGANSHQTQDAMNRLRVTPEMFGAVGDGVANDTTAWADTLAFLALVGGGVVACAPGGTYVITSGLTVSSNISIDLQTATIDASGLTSAGNFPRLFYGLGTYDTIVNLTSDVARAATAVGAVVTGYAAHDMVLVGARLAFDASNTNTHIAELAFVRSTTGATVSLQAPLAMAYGTANTAYIQKVIPVENFSVINGTLIGPTYDTVATGKSPSLVDIRGGKNIVVDRVVCKRVSFAGVCLVDCVFSKVTNCSFEETLEANELGYGISFANATQDCVAIGNSFYHRRHAMTTNNFGSVGGYGSALRGVVRRCKFAHNVVYKAANYDVAGTSVGDAIDTHGACEDIEILDNTVYHATGNGVNFEGRSGVIRGNTIYFAGASGVRVHNETDHLGTVTVNDNKILSVGANAIWIEEGYRGAGIGYASINVNDNHILESSSVVGIYVDVNVAAALAPVLTISANTVVVGGRGIQVIGGRGIAVTGNAVVSGADAIWLTTVLNSTISGNTLKSTVASGRGVVATGSNRNAITGNAVTVAAASTGSIVSLVSAGGIGCEGNVVSGNTISNVGANTGFGVVVDNNGTYNMVSNNIVRGMNTPISLGVGAGNISINNIA